MKATTLAERVRDDFVGELTDTALETAARLAGGVSVDEELQLWKALRSAARRLPDRASTDEVVAGLAQAAYCVTLRSGFRGSFVELELGLWNELRRAAVAAPH